MFVAKLPSLDIDFKALPDKVKPYSYPRLERVNDTLNQLNSLIWDQLIPQTPKGSAVYGRAVNRLSPYIHAKKQTVGGLFYGAENITNAWLKMRELLVRFPPKPDSRGELASYHMAEAPGAFVSSLKTYLNLDLKLDEDDWEWRAQSLNEDVAPHALKDQFGLIANNPDNWIVIGSGDITNPDIVKQTSTAVVKQIGKVQIFTSDPKGPVSDWNKEAESQFPLFLGSICGMLMSMKAGGTAYLKVFSLANTYSVNLLAVLATCFKNVYITKPLTSKPANSERYIVAQDYRTNISKKDILRKLLNQLRTGRVGKVFIPNSLIPGKFAITVREVEEEINSRQTRILNEVVQSMVNETYTTPIDYADVIVEWAKVNMPPKKNKELKEILLHEVRIKMGGKSEPKPPSKPPPKPKKKSPLSKDPQILNRRDFDVEYPCDSEFLSDWFCDNLYSKFYLPIMKGKSREGVTIDFITEYLDAVSSTPEWAASFEVSSVSDVYGVNLEVWRSGRSHTGQPDATTTSGEEINRLLEFEVDNPTETIRVIYRGRSHYNALIETNRDNVYKEVMMAGDGNCFYRSVAYQLFEEGAKVHPAVRRDISGFLRQNPGRILDVLPGRFPTEH
jgi:hypothetical protein